MQKFQARRRFREALYSWPLLLVLFICVILLASAVLGVYEKYGIAQAALSGATKENDALLARKGGLESKIEALKTPRGVEEEIRSHYQVAKPGEEVVVVVDNTTTTPATTTPAVSWWKRWWPW